MLGTFNGAAGFVVAEQFTATYLPHIFRDANHYQQWRTQNPKPRIVRATNAHGQTVRGVDHRGEIYDQSEEKEKDMNTQANQPQAGTPKPSETTIRLLEQIAAQGKAELEALHEIRAALGIIAGKLETQTAASLQTADHAMAAVEQMKNAAGVIRLFCETAKPAPATATASNGGSEAVQGNYRDFDSEVITVGMDDNGKIVYKIKGGPFTKFGVRVWPETLPVLGIRAEELKVGEPRQFNAKVRALLDEKGQAKKVIGLAK